jgi:hypothetical protein
MNVVGVVDPLTKTVIDEPAVYVDTTASIRTGFGTSTLIEDTVLGDVLDKTRFTRAPTANVAPVARPVTVVVEVRLNVVGVVAPPTRIEIDDPAT